MDWIIHNWSLLVVLVVFIGVGVYYFRRFAALPSDVQLLKVKEWLLYCVMIVEKEYSSGTGQLKLRAAYNMFIERFPSLVEIIPFELFSTMVDETLVEMRKILSTNKDIEAYIKGDD